MLAGLAAGHELRVRCTHRRIADHYEIVDRRTTRARPFNARCGGGHRRPAGPGAAAPDGPDRATWGQLLRVEIQPLPHAQSLVARSAAAPWPNNSRVRHHRDDLKHVGDWRIGPRRESLRACVARLGSTRAAGHYIAVLKRGDDWFAYDDTTFSGYLVQNLESREATVESVSCMQDHGELFATSGCPPRLNKMKRKLEQQPALATCV